MQKNQLLTRIILLGLSGGMCQAMDDKDEKGKAAYSQHNASSSISSSSVTACGSTSSNSLSSSAPCSALTIDTKSNDKSPDKEQKEDFESITLSDLQQKIALLKPLKNLVDSHPVYQLKDLRNLICSYLGLAYNIELKTDPIMLGSDIHPNEPACPNIVNITLTKNYVNAFTRPYPPCRVLCPSSGINSYLLQWNLSDGSFQYCDVIFKPQAAMMPKQGLTVNVPSNKKDANALVSEHTIRISIGQSHMLQYTFEGKSLFQDFQDDDPKTSLNILHFPCSIQ